MYQLRKGWEDGGRLTVTYEGRGDGDVTFESDSNDGLDRETSVTFVDFSKDIRVECKVVQSGKREVFSVADGDFILADNETFDVVKDGIQK